MADRPDRTTIIGPATRVSGELRGDENLVVQGRVEGRIAIAEVLTIESGGIVQADVEAREVVVSGVLAGTVTAGETIRLTNGARVVGDLAAPRVIIEAGAAYRGRLDMGDVDEAAPATRTRARGAEDRAEGANGATRTPPRLAPPARVAPAAAPPRMAPPPAMAAGAPRPAAAPRAVTPPPAPRPAAPPAMPRPEATATTAAAAAPAWAKKKALKRR